MGTSSTNALRDAEARYRALFDRSFNAVYIHDLEGNFVDANDAALKLLGYDRAELPNLNFTSLIAVEELPRALELIREISLTHTQAKPSTFSLRRRDGESVFVETMSSIIHEAGQPPLIQGIARDITHRVQAEDDLKKSEAKYRGLFNSIDEGFCVCELIFDDNGTPYDYRFIEVNPMFEHHSGLNDVIGKTAREVVPQFESYWVETYSKVALEGASYRFIQESKGLKRWFDIYAFKIGLPEEHRFAVMFKDITERKQSQDELRGKYDELERFFTVTLDLLCIADVDGTFIRVNKAWETVLGYPTEAIEGQPILNFVHPDDVEATIDALNRLDKQETVIGFVNRYRTRDGDYRMLEWRTNPMGRTIYAAARDITEREEAQQRELSLTLESERSDLLRRFIEKTSHEFRTPLTVISSSAALMARSESPENRQAKAEVIQAYINEMSKLVDMMLTITRLESGATMPFSSVDVPALLSIASHNLLIQYGDTPRLRQKWASDLPAIQGSSVDLTEAITHILDNAYQFTPPDGVITIKTGQEDHHVWVKVRDTGSGMDDATLQHVFEIFWRRDEAHSTPGFGLGLPIAQKIIEMHNGDIEIESAPDEGTTVTIRLPIHTETP